FPVYHHTPFFFLSSYPTHPHLHSFPTRRSSDLPVTIQSRSEGVLGNLQDIAGGPTGTSFITASGSPYEFDEWRYSDLQQNGVIRSEEHTSELQSRGHLVCRLLLEKKKQKHRQHD